MYRLFRRLCAATLSLIMLASLCGCGLSVRLDKIFNGGDVADEDAAENPPNPVGALSWASGDNVIVMDDPERLAEAVAKLYESAADEGVGVEYKNEAFSLDGQQFACYIGNPITSHFPLFITVYGDDEYQEELYVSGLLKPGQAFNQITLSRALTEPVSTLPVCYTQVFEPHTGTNDTDEFAIRAQAVITLNFNIMDVDT